MQNKLNTIFYILFFSILGISAQELNFKINKYSIENGLSQNTITDFCEDKYGTIWISTQNGLNRFNGYEFKKFYSEIDNINSLPSNYILGLYHDTKDNIWITTNGNQLVRYNLIKESFERILIKEKNDPIELDGITGVFEDKGNLWIFTINKGILIYVIDQKRIVKELNTKNIGFNIDIIWGSIIKGENVYIFTNNAIHIFNKVTNKLIKTIQVYPLDFFVFPNKILFYKDRIYATYNNGDFLEVQPFEGKITRIISKNNYSNIAEEMITDFEFDNYGKLWFGTMNNGLFIWDGKIIKNYRIENPIDYIKENRISSIIKDRKGNIWVGTTKEGFYIFTYNSVNFGKLEFNKYKKNSLTSSGVYSIAKDSSGNYLFATPGAGFDVFTNKWGKIKNIKQRQINLSMIVSNEIYTICITKDGRILTGNETGVTIIDKNYKLLRNEFYTGPGSLLPSFSVSAIFQDRDANLWIGTNYNGLIKTDSSLTRKIAFYNLKNDKNNNKLSSNQIIIIKQASNGDILVATVDAGINIIDKTNGNVKIIKHIPGITKSLIDDYVSAIDEDDDGDFWIGTIGGISVFDKNWNFKFNLNENSGLISNNIYAIIHDNNNNIWISSGRGISKFDKKNKRIYNFSKEDGLLDIEYNLGAVLKDNDGRLLFGGLNGLTYFYPTDIKYHKKAARLVWEKIKIGNTELNVGEKLNGRIILEKNLNETEEIVLNYNEHPITFDFVELDYSNSVYDSFSYKIENLDKNWTNIGSQHSITFTSIPAGEYVLLVKSNTLEKNNTNKILKMRIIIIPPFYDTAYFKIFLILVIISFTYWGHKWNTKRIVERNILLEKIVKERTAELKESNKLKDKYFSIIAHDLKNPFLSLFGYSDILNEEFATLDETEKKLIFKNIKKNLRNLYALLDNLLNWSSLQTGKLNFSNSRINLFNTVQINIDLLTDNFRRKSIIINNQVNAEIVINTDVNVLNMLLRNLISNAIKFTPNSGTITISNRFENNKIGIEVADSGVGISDEDIKTILTKKDIISRPGTANEKGTGLGLSLCNELITKMGGELKIQSEVGIGTRITILIPFEESKTKIQNIA